MNKSLSLFQTSGVSKCIQFYLDSHVISVKPKMHSLETISTRNIFLKLWHRLILCSISTSLYTIDHILLEILFSIDLFVIFLWFSSYCSGPWWLFTLHQPPDAQLPGVYIGHSSHLYDSVQFSSFQSLSHVQLFATPWTTARQASLSIRNSWSNVSNIRYLYD